MICKSTPIHILAKIKEQICKEIVYLENQFDFVCYLPAVSQFGAPASGILQ